MEPLSEQVVQERGARSGPPAPAPAPRPNVLAGRSPLGLALSAVRAGPLFILLTVTVAMALLSPFFLTERNLQNLGAQSSIIAALAIGQLLVIVVRGIDISVGSTVALSGVLGATVAATAWGSSGLVVILTMLLVGLAVGTLNALLIVKGRLVQPLIVTVATLGIVRGLALVITNGETKLGMPPAVVDIGNGFVGPIPASVVVVGFLAVIAYIFMSRTQWGRWLYAVGGNPEAAKRLGVSSDRVVMSAYVICGLTAAIGGVIVAGRTNAGSPNAGNLMELDAITAVVIGGASLAGGRGSVGNVLAGALILGIIRNGLDLQDVNPFWQNVAIGCIVLVALELDVLRRALEERMRVRGSVTRRGAGAAGEEAAR
ncbi:Ribose import permease protein RbsC [Baekduia alba]|uniref:ABC transporter permease n=1 Tax=Baekduia alba TaxID=2997333 RepID=UPI0023411D9A|nr:ABC transporter permease [Baekduia alba]WCB94964.1 Ribose import permease protein RbsC [Baekduia alba]